MVYEKVNAPEPSRKPACYRARAFSLSGRYSYGCLSHPFFLCVKYIFHIFLVTYVTNTARRHAYRYYASNGKVVLHKQCWLIRAALQHVEYQWSLCEVSRTEHDLDSTTILV